MNDKIKIVGAREHNLKNVNIEIPKNHNWYMQPINNYLIETKNYLDTPIIYKDKHYITFQMLNPANDNLDDVLVECKNIIEQLWR